MPQPVQDGLKWEQTLFGPVPQWTRDPSIAAIERVCRQQLVIPAKSPCTVSFHASGLLNKLYLVKCHHATETLTAPATDTATGGDGRHLIMRVSLPVYPRCKTRAEVATLRWVRGNTTIPVPEVFCFDDSPDNEIGFEWILMEFMQGTSARKRWRGMSMEQKVALTKQIAAFQVQLLGSGKPRSNNNNSNSNSNNAFAGMIGALEEVEEQEEEEKNKQEDSRARSDASTIDSRNSAKVIRPGTMVSAEFFVGDRVRYEIPRGPFRSSHEWLSAMLNTIILDQTAILDKAEDEADIEDATNTLCLARKLLSLIDQVFFPLSPTTTESEVTALYHHDLHLNNILVNEDGEITAILDWECVSVLPLWMFTLVPKFLDEPVREEEPQREIYADITPEEEQEEAAIRERDGSDRSCSTQLDNEGKNELYFIHRMEYEATQLRKVYEARLRELWPERLLLLLLENKSYVKADFFQAVLQCDSFWPGQALAWAERMEKGEIVRLHDVGWRTVSSTSSSTS